MQSSLSALQQRVLALLAGIDPPTKDGGFSPPTLAWVLRGVRLRGAEQHAPFRDWLIHRLLH